MVNWSRIGNKLSQGLSKVSRIGQKVLGGASRLGNRIYATGSKIVGGVERIPVLGPMLSPVTGVVRSGLGLVKNFADATGSGASMIKEGEAIIRQGAESLRTGDTQSAMDVVRRTKAVGKQAKGEIERARDVKKEAVALTRRG